MSYTLIYSWKAQIFFHFPLGDYNEKSFRSAGLRCHVHSTAHSSALKFVPLNRCKRYIIKLRYPVVTHIIYTRPIFRHATFNCYINIFSNIIATTYVNNAHLNAPQSVRCNIAVPCTCVLYSWEWIYICIS